MVFKTPCALLLSFCAGRHMSSWSIYIWVHRNHRTTVTINIVLDRCASSYCVRGRAIYRWQNKPIFVYVCVWGISVYVTCTVCSLCNTHQTKTSKARVVCAASLMLIVFGHTHNQPAHTAQWNTWTYTASLRVHFYGVNYNARWTSARVHTSDEALFRTHINSGRGGARPRDKSTFCQRDATMRVCWKIVVCVSGKRVRARARRVSK